MKNLSVGSQRKKKIAVSAVAAGALFIMIPILAAWLSPFNARAGEDGPRDAAPAAATAPPEQELTLLEQAGTELADELVVAAATATVNSAIAQAQSEDAPTAAAPSADGAETPDGTNATDGDVGGAVTGFWSLAWSKAWPPLKNILSNLWTLTKTVFLALWGIVKDVGSSVDANINANSGATGAPVNAAP